METAGTVHADDESKSCSPQASTTPVFQSWSAEDFLARDLPPKEPIAEGVLYRRDIVALAGRRRHGKTTLVSNLLVSLTTGRPDFLGYAIPHAFRASVFFLEDDPREIQDKMRRLLNGASTEGRLAIHTREDFYRCSIGIDVGNEAFRKAVLNACSQHKPDVVVFDNMAHLVGADYNNSRRIHSLVQFAWTLTAKFNAAVIIAAHPRKRSNDGDYAPSLRHGAEDFFEEIMGSSHFINSCGSLWGVERNLTTEQTDFLAGAQRVTGQQRIAALAKGDDDWFQIVSDLDVNLGLALNTPKRRQAWDLLPDAPSTFSYVQAVEIVKPTMAESTFYDWWTLHLRRLGLIVDRGDRYLKAKA